MRALELQLPRCKSSYTVELSWLLDKFGILFALLKLLLTENAEALGVKKKKEDV